MPKVLRIINRFNLGGPTYNAAYLSKYLEDEFETLLIGGKQQESEASSLHITKSLNIEVMVIDEMTRKVGIRDDWLAFRRISRVIKEFKPDIVHTHASKAGTLGRIAARLNRVQCIVHTFHGHVFENYFGSFKSKIIIYFERFLAGFTDRIIAISDLQKQDLVHRYKIAPASKVKVIPLGFELERFADDQLSKRNSFRREQGLNDEIAIGIIGRLVPIKNHPLFLHAMAELKNEGIEFKAFIIGDGELKENLMNLTVHLGLNHTGLHRDVTFTSWMLDVDKVMAGLDIVVLTSLNEGTPVSLIEAQAAAKVVVSTAVGGVADVVMDGCTGFLVESDDLQGIKSALKMLLENPEMCQRMGLEGRKHVFEQYHVRRLIIDVKKLYRELLQ
ncbi:MAG: glycosyltransferase [Vicingaceae bacterium]